MHALDDTVEAGIILRHTLLNAGNGSYGICRVIGAARSPSPDPKR